MLLLRILVCVIAFTVLLLGIRSPAKEQQPTFCLDDRLQEEVRVLMLEGIKQGMLKHTLLVFDNWVKDPSEQPERAIRGMQSAISAYVRSRKALDVWDLPRCPEEEKKK